MSRDLGTANTLVYVRSRGIVVNEPSVVAIDIPKGEALAFGADAWQVVGSSSGQIHGLRPLRHGADADPNICQEDGDRCALDPTAGGAGPGLWFS